MTDTSTPAAPIGFSHLPDASSLTTEQAQREIGEAMAGRHLPAYHDGSDPGHAAAVARMEALHARLQDGEEQHEEAPADLAPALAPHEVHDKVHNFLDLGGASDADAVELREGLAHAAAALDLDHEGLGVAIMQMNHALKNGITATAEDAEAHLREAWCERYNQNLAAANRALDHIERTRPGARDFLARTGLGNDVTTISVLARAGQRLRRSRHGGR